jgi:hypothetical protein
MDTEVARGELDAGHHAHACSRAGVVRFVDAVHRVVIGDGDRLHSSLAGESHELIGRTKTVGSGRMAMKIDAGHGLL